VEVATGLGGSFQLVTPAPKPVREMTKLPRETQKDGDTKTLKQYKRSLNMHTQKNTRPNRAVWTGSCSCAHGKLPKVTNCWDMHDNFFQDYSMSTIWHWQHYQQLYNSMHYTENHTQKMTVANIYKKHTINGNNEYNNS